MLTDGFFDDAVFVALGCEVADSEEVADSFESIDESSGRFGCRCVFCSVADGGADTFVKELDEFLYCQGIEGPVVCTSHFLCLFWKLIRQREQMARSSLCQPNFRLRCHSAF